MTLIVHTTMADSKPITRITMFKVPSAEGQQILIEGYKKLLEDSKKVRYIQPVSSSQHHPSSHNHPSRAEPTPEAGRQALHPIAEGRTRAHHDRG